MGVHCTKFSIDKQHILSASDDGTVRFWDLSTGIQITHMKGHLDYVRAVSSFTNDSKLWLTGGYDHSILMWDVRCNYCSLKMDHGTQVENLVVLPTGILAISVGGNKLCLWDLSSGGNVYLEKNSSC